MRRKGVGIVAALLLVLALIPMGVASAAQGTIKLLDTAGDDKSKYSAVASDSATHNIAVIQVTDSDLDVPSDIPATVDISSTNYEIVGRADGATTSVLVVDPGVFFAGCEAPLTEGMRDPALASLGRVGDPVSDLAPLLDLLADPRGAFTTGGTIVADGGTWMALCRATSPSCRRAHSYKGELRS